MTGTEKQVKWAEDIKAQRNRDFENFLADFDSKAAKALGTGKATEAQIAQGRKIMTDAIAKVNANESAEWWIETQAMTAQETLKSLR